MKGRRFRCLLNFRWYTRAWNARAALSADVHLSKKKMKTKQSLLSPWLTKHKKYHGNCLNYYRFLDPFLEEIFLSDVCAPAMKLQQSVAIGTCVLRSLYKNYHAIMEPFLNQLDSNINRAEQMFPIWHFVDKIFKLLTTVRWNLLKFMHVFLFVKLSLGSLRLM